MRTVRIIILVLSATLLSSVVKAGNTYPPENAAVLYYKILDFYPPDGEIMDKILDYATGGIELDEDIAKHLDKYQHVIKELTVAGDIKSCNWGIDFSQGLETLLAGLGECKKYSWLLLADARRLASEGDYYEAIDRCITAEKLASHVSGDILINSLVATAISVISDKCISHIMSETAADKVKLHYLRSQLDRFDNRIERMKTGLLAEKHLHEVLFDKTSPYRLTYEILTGKTSGIATPVDPNTKDPVIKETLEKIKAGDAGFLDKALKYNIGQINDAAAAFDRPYQQACENLSKQIEKLENDAKKKSEAMLAHMFMPACTKIYVLGVRSQNSLNALKMALEIFIVKAKTGKLPKKLPANTPNDLYTCKQMVYEITDDGFILRCQGPDTKKDKEKDTYKFKVKK